MARLSSYNRFVVDRIYKTLREYFKTSVYSMSEMISYLSSDYPSFVRFLRGDNYALNTNQILLLAMRLRMLHLDQYDFEDLLTRENKFEGEFF